MCKEKSVKEKIRDIIFPEDGFGPPVQIESIRNKRVILPGDIDIQSKNETVKINGSGKLNIKEDSFEDFIMGLNSVITKYHNK